MIQNNAAVTFSGEASQMLEKMKSTLCGAVKFSNLWFDNGYTKTVKNQDTAYALISFVFDPKMLLKNAGVMAIQHQTYQLRNCSQRRKKRR